MAAGDMMFSLNALNFSRPSSAAATPDQRVGSDGTVLNVWDFDHTTNERIEVNLDCPQNYSTANNIEVILKWSSTVDGTEEVKWNVQFKQMRDNADDIDTKSYSSAQTVTSETASANGQPKYSTITFTNGQASSIDPGVHFFIRVTRDATDAADTMNAADAELWAIELREVAP